MVKLISALLSLAMLFGTGTAPKSTQVTANVPITVGAQQAIWTKSAVKTSKTYTNPQNKYESSYFSSYGSNTYTFWKNVEFTEKGYVYTNPFEVTITNFNDFPVNGYTGSAVTGYYVNYIYKHGTTGAYNSVYNQIISCTFEDKEVAGAYIEDVIAVSNSFPMNGKHTDGYWYVFKNLVED